MKNFAERQNSYVLVQFKIKHSGCWSNALAETGSIAHTIVVKPFKDRHYVFGAIEVQSEFQKGFKLFYNGFKHSGKIREVVQLDTIDSRRKLYRIMFREKYDDMVSTVLYEHSSLFQIDYVDETGEEMVVIIPKDDTYAVRKDLENLGDLIYYKIKQVNIDEFFSSNLDITPQEMHVLHWAYSFGYYNVPRQAHLEEVSAKVGLSKSAFAEALRKAESKVITKWESEHKFLRGLFSR